MKNHFATSVHRDGYIYGFDNDKLCCMDLKRGRVKWKTRRLQKGAIVGLQNRNAIIFTEGGMLALITLKPSEYTELSRFYVFPDEYCLTIPTVANGRIFVRSREEIACYDLTGKFN